MDRKKFEKAYAEYKKTGRKPMELQDYRVDNAVILAAGIAKDTMYAPPKGLLKVDGVPIIERQICQLKEAGIDNIYIVVGYKKEMYFYLEEKYDVTLIGNPRLDRNNIYSLYLAKDKLRNTYVCACDYYYKENPFSQYEFAAYHGTSYIDDARYKFVVETNSKGRITALSAGAERGECIHGLAYFDSEFSKTIVNLMELEIESYRISSLFWEEFVAKHLDELDMFIKRLDSCKVVEFDELSALKPLNVLFVNSVSTEIVNNICEQLQCRDSNSISNVDILETGHSNITFKVIVDKKPYVYRYPGISGKNIVDRTRETYANKLAKKLGIDKTLIYIDENGHKISTFVPHAKPLMQDDMEGLNMLACNVRKLHEYNISDKIKHSKIFNPVKEADRLLSLACSNKDNLFEIFQDMRSNVHYISRMLEGDCFQKAICHCNLNSNNCLITDDSFDLIDWEFSGYCDIAYDFPFLGNYEFRMDDFKKYLDCYYQRKPSAIEFKHWLGYRAIQYWYYICWALYKESINEECGNVLLTFYHNCKEVIRLALPLIESEIRTLDN